eukprot:CAMPEP_0196823464 /NCGR_PEP_ID=MMETSP1362-20130617/87580_1 /TAXON_ID=163516 /ORGANISM="Leptocylindrus danicus, Strain CCMP1856" /LENGTH=33 /DNA_ID= /DNA_START= /DNA_END= /DNA_ORIENTATION=
MEVDLNHSIKEDDTKKRENSNADREKGKEKEEA